ncbi:MAG: hypothetical protein IKM33_07225 [Clostridia bacterium]|nr:hypothetical protein [Clostridia bacterium]
MIVVRTRDSRMFEEAYFVVRPEADRGGRDEPDMLWEANRILENSMAGCRGEASDTRSPLLPRKGVLRGVMWFLAGLLSGGGTVGLLWLLL